MVRCAAVGDVLPWARTKKRKVSEVAPAAKESGRLFPIAIIEVRMDRAFFGNGRWSVTTRETPAAELVGTARVGYQFEVILTNKDLPASEQGEPNESFNSSGLRRTITQRAGRSIAGPVDTQAPREIDNSNPAVALFRAAARAKWQNLMQRRRRAPRSRGSFYGLYRCRTAVFMIQKR
jgi:hypothetical protein